MQRIYRALTTPLRMAALPVAWTDAFLRRHPLSLNLGILLVLITVALVGVIVYLDSTATAAFDNGFTYRRAITIDGSNVSGTSSLSNFPLLFSTTTDFLKHTSSGGKVENGSGYDIVFATSTNPSAGTKLDHEIETYSSSTGEVVFWIRIPTLEGSDTASTTIYMFYGSSTISFSQENVTGIWDSGYKAVYHLKESGDEIGNDYIDSTSNNRDAQGGAGDPGAVPTQVTGKIGKGQDFDGSNDLLKYTLSATETGNTTVSVWAKWDVASPNQGDSAFSSADSTPDGTFDVEHSGNPGPCAEKNRLDYRDVGSNLEICFDTATTSFAYLTFTFDETTLTTYTDATVNATSTVTSATRFDVYKIGINRSDGKDFEGVLDEVRVSTTTRSSDWIKTEFDNQSSPNTFYSIEAENQSFSESVSDTVSLAESIALALGLSRSDSTSLAESAAQAVSLSRSEGASLAESMTPGFSRTESTSLAESIQRVISRGITDAASLVESAAQALGFSRSDGVSLAESTDAALGSPASDLTSLAESIASVLGLSRIESTNLAESVQMAISRGISDAVNLAESIAPGFSRSEAASLAESIALAVGKGASDASSLVESLSQAVGLSRSDGASLAESVLAALASPASDATAIAESIASALALPRAETTTLAESIQSTLSQGFTDAASLAESATAALGSPASETASLTESIAAALGLSRTDTASFGGVRRRRPRLLPCRNGQPDGVGPARQRQGVLRGAKHGGVHGPGAGLVARRHYQPGGVRRRRSGLLPHRDGQPDRVHSAR